MTAKTCIYRAFTSDCVSWTSWDLLIQLPSFFKWFRTFVAWNTACLSSTIIENHLLEHILFINVYFVCVFLHVYTTGHGKILFFSQAYIRKTWNFSITLSVIIHTISTVCCLMLSVFGASWSTLLQIWSNLSQNRFRLAQTGSSTPPDDTCTYCTKMRHSHIVYSVCVCFLACHPEQKLWCCHTVICVVIFFFLHCLHALFGNALDIVIALCWGVLVL